MYRSPDDGAPPFVQVISGKRRGGATWCLIGHDVTTYRASHDSRSQALINVATPHQFSLNISHLLRASNLLYSCSPVHATGVADGIPFPMEHSCAWSINVAQIFTHSAMGVHRVLGNAASSTSGVTQYACISITRDKNSD